MKYHKKPVIVEAIQYTEQTRDECIAHYGARCDYAGHYGSEHVTHLRIDTLKGSMFVDLGDWIIRGVDGELDSCKDEIFQATYEPVEE